MFASRLRFCLMAPLLGIAVGCVNGVGWLPDSSGFIFTTQHGHLVHYDVATKATRVLVEDTKSNTYWPAVSPDGKTVAVARLSFEKERNARLQVVVYDRQGKVVHESKRLAFGVSDQKPEDMNTTTQMFWDPSGKKLLIYGSIHGTYGTTGVYDLATTKLQVWEQTIPSIYGSTPLRPDGQGFLMIKLIDRGEKVEHLATVDWQGQVNALTARFDLNEEKLAMQLAWPVLRSSAWTERSAAAVTSSGRTHIDLDKGEATLHAAKPGEISMGQETIWMSAKLPSGIQVVVLTTAKGDKAFHQSRIISWDPKAMKQIAEIANGADHLVGLFPSPDKKHVLVRVWEGDRRGPDADMMYVINAQGQVADTIDVFDRFGKKD